MNKLAIIVTLCLVAGSAHAGAWTQKRGDLFVSKMTRLFTSNDFFDTEGNAVSTLPYVKYETNTYTEYGLSNDWTVGANLSYAVIQRQFITNAFISTMAGPVQVPLINGAANLGLVDPEIFVRGRIYQDDRGVLSGELLHKMPSQLERANDTIAGTEERDLEFALLGGLNFEWMNENHFIDTRAAYRIRGGQLKNQTRLEVRLGMRFWDDFLFVPAAYWIFSDEVPDAASFARNGREDYDLTKLEATLMYDLTRYMSLQISGFSHVEGKNVGDGEAISAGLAYRF